MIKALSACLIVGIAGAQTPTPIPALSGKWTLDPRAVECRAGAGASGIGASGIGAGCGDGGGAKDVCGENLSIELSADAIKLQRVVNGETLTLVLALDGSPVKRPVPPCRERKAPTDPVIAKLMERELAAVKEHIVAGSDDMTTKASREASRVVLRSSYSTGRGVNGDPPWLVIEQTQRLSLTTLGQLVVDTDRTATETTGRVIKTKSRLVYARAKAFDRPMP